MIRAISNFFIGSSKQNNTHEKRCISYRELINEVDLLLKMNEESKIRLNETNKKINELYERQFHTKIN